MTSARTRLEIAQATGTTAEIAKRFGVCTTTVRRFKARAGSTPTRQQLSKQCVLGIYNDPGTQLQIALKFAVSTATVAGIKSGRYHAQITGAQKTEHRRKTITDELREAIEQSTEPQRETAARLGVDVSTVKKYQCLYRRKHGIEVTRRRHTLRNGHLFARKAEP